MPFSLAFGRSLLLLGTLLVAWVLCERYGAEKCDNIIYPRDVPEEVQFAKWLLDIGYRTINRQSDSTVELASEMVCRDPNTIIESNYPAIEGPTPRPAYFLERMILGARNADVEGLNSAF
ncbi:hypothetical protein B0H14DRAFT_2576277 [Mycena olivaceomarginata]|nr:hypothetical protein B0H14DRAFT_2576277 [Mycena olivaceomarginata]